MTWIWTYTKHFYRKIACLERTISYARKWSLKIHDNSCNRLWYLTLQVQDIWYIPSTYFHNSGQHLCCCSCWSDKTSEGSSDHLSFSKPNKYRLWRGVKRRSLIRYDSITSLGEKDMFLCQIEMKRPSNLQHILHTKMLNSLFSGWYVGEKDIVYIVWGRWTGSINFGSWKGISPIIKFRKSW